MNVVCRPYKLAVVGGIGSGKSVVSRLLTLMGVPVYDCDTRAKWLMNHDAILREALSAAIGSEVYGADGMLDRAHLSSYMFGYPERVAKVNGIVHPAVREDFRLWAQASNAPIVGVETAILYEAGMNADVDAVCMVYAPTELRVQRAMLRDATDAVSVRRRMNSQMSDDELLSRATYIIYNDDSKSLIEQVAQMLVKIKAERF